MDNDALKSTLKKIEDSIKNDCIDKDFLLDVAQQYGVDEPKNKRCPDCWKDFAIVLRSKLRTIIMVEDGTHKYILKDGVDVIFKGERINNGMLTDRKAKQLLKEGFATYHFAKMPE